MSYAVILEGLLLENRVEFLRQKFVPLIAQMTPFHHGYPGDVDVEEHDLDDGGNLVVIPDKVFDWVIGFDPTPNKQYSQWLLSQFITGKVLPEDVYKIGEDLADYHRVKQRMPVEMRDINRYANEVELMKVLAPYRETKSRGEMNREIHERMLKESVVLLDTDRYLVVSPKTEEASCYFGRNTRWCTAATGSRNMFSRYNDDGPLYIVLDKPNNTRWQFHFEDQQFMDEEDHPINLEKMMHEHPEINKLFGRVIDAKVTSRFSRDVTITQQKNGTTFRPIGGLFTDSLLHVQVSRYGSENIITNVTNIDPVWVFHNGRKILTWLKANDYGMNMARGQVVRDPLWMLGFTYYKEWSFWPSRVSDMKEIPAEDGYRWVTWKTSISKDPPYTVHYMLDPMNSPVAAIRVNPFRTFEITDFSLYDFTEDEAKAVANYLLTHFPKTGLKVGYDSDIGLETFAGVDFNKVRPDWFD